MCGQPDGVDVEVFSTFTRVLSYFTDENLKPLTWAQQILIIFAFSLTRQSVPGGETGDTFRV